MELALRDYQTDAIAAMKQRRSDRADLQRGLIVLPTGAGKTVIFSHLLSERCRETVGHAVVLVHRDELVQQAIDKLQTVDSSLLLGIVKADQNQLQADVVVASVQTLAREARLANATRVWTATGGVHTVIVDEAHHSQADSWQAVLAGLRCFNAAGPMTIGFTATPERADGKALGETWQEVIYRRSILDMIREGYLCDVRGIRVQVPTLDLNAVKKTHGDYAGGDLSRAMINADAPEAIVRAYQEHAAGRKALLFTPTIEMARACADAFLNAGIAGDWASGELPLEERRRTLQRFHDGETMVLANALLLTEGYDEPSVDCVIVARPTRSHALYVQQCGRGTRLHPGKKDLLVLDVVGASDDNKLVTIVDLAGRDEKGRPRAEPQEGETVLEAAERAEQAQMAYDRLVSEAVDLFRENAAKTPRQKFAWVALGTNRYVLGLGEEALLLHQDAGGWTVTKRQQRRSAGQLFDDLTPLYHASNMGYVQGFAEDYARNHTGSRLAAVDAPWRQSPASEKQLGTLRRMGVPYWEGISKGEASDLLGKRFEASKWRGVR